MAQFRYNPLLHQFLHYNPTNIQSNFSRKQFKYNGQGIVVQIDKRRWSGKIGKTFIISIPTYAFAHEIEKHTLLQPSIV